MPVELREHQEKILAKVHNGCILKGGVGTGKSITSIAYWYRYVCAGQYKTPTQDWVAMEKPTDLYIITTAKKRDSLDWIMELGPFGISSDPATSVEPVRVMVDSWNNILEYVGVKDAFFIFDEQRLVGSGAWVKAFLKIAKSNQWILLSATPGDTWMDYIPVFVANGFYRNRTHFVDEHVVWKSYMRYPVIDKFINTGVLEKYRRQVVIDMPYERHTVRHIRNVIVPYNEALYKRVREDRWHVYEERPIKDVQEWGTVQRKVLNSDPSRLGEIMKLLEKHPRLIVFYNFNYELEALRTLGTNLKYPIAEWNGHNHQEIPHGKKWVYLVQYTAGAEGWNCISTDSMAFYSLNHSYKVWEQSQGRTDRLNTPFIDLYYYAIRSTAWYDMQIVKALATKRDFNIMDFAGSWRKIGRELAATPT